MAEITTLQIKVATTGAAKAIRDLDKLGLEAEDVSRSTKKATKSTLQLGRAFSRLGVSSLALSALIGSQIRAWDKYDAKMKEVRSISGLTKKEFAGIRTELLSVSSQLGISTNDIAQASYNAVSAGIAARDLATFMRDAGRLAVAGVASTAASVDLLTTAINAYALESSEAATLSDKFFTAVKLGKTTVEELSASFGQAAPLAATLKVSIDELLVSVVVMTKQGISTAEAFTKIRAIMSGMIKPTEELQAQILRLGFANGQTLLQSKGLQGTLTALEKAVDGDAGAMSKMFPRVEGLTGVLALLTQEGELAKKALDGMKKSSSSTADAFVINSNTTGNALKRMSAAFVGWGEDMEATFGIANSLLTVLGGFANLARGDDFLGQRDPLITINKDDVRALREARKELNAYRATLRNLSALTKTHDVDLTALAKRYSELTNKGKRELKGFTDIEKAFIVAARVMERANDELVIGSAEWLLKLRGINGFLNLSVNSYNALNEAQKEQLKLLGDIKLAEITAKGIAEKFGQDKILNLEEERKKLQNLVTLRGEATDQEWRALEAIDARLKKLREEAKLVKPKVLTEAEKKRERLKSDLSFLSESLLTEEELIRSNEEKKLDILKEAHSLKLLGEEEFNAKKKQINEQTEEDIDRLRKEKLDQSLASATDFFSDLQTVGETFGKKGAALAKGAAIAQATISTYRNAVDAYGAGMKISPPIGGPHLATAFAAAAVAAGLANVAKISSAPTGFAQGGIVGGSSFSGDNVRASVNSGEMILTRAQQANLFRQSNSQSNKSTGVNGAATVNIINQTTDKVEANVIQRDNGQLDIVIRRAVDTAKAEITDEINAGFGGLSPVLERTFGLQRGN